MNSLLQVNGVILAVIISGIIARESIFIEANNIYISENFIVPDIYLLFFALIGFFVSIIMTLIPYIFMRKFELAPRPDALARKYLNKEEKTTKKTILNEVIESWKANRKLNNCRNSLFLASKLSLFVGLILLLKYILFNFYNII